MGCKEPVYLRQLIRWELPAPVPSTRLGARLKKARHGKISVLDPEPFESFSHSLVYKTGYRKNLNPNSSTVFYLILAVEVQSGNTRREKVM